MPDQCLNNLEEQEKQLIIQGYTNYIYLDQDGGLTVKYQENPLTPTVIFKNTPHVSLFINVCYGNIIKERKRASLIGLIIVMGGLIN